MANHFSTIGLIIQDRDDFIEHVKAVCQNGELIHTDQGIYIKWEIGEGAQLWAQSNKNKSILGMNPHFSGSGRMKVRIEKRIKRDNHTLLDGTFYGWAGITDDNEEEYPLVFDVPDMDRYSSIEADEVVTVQLAAFAHELVIYDNEEEFKELQDFEPKLAAESFIPTGLFNSDKQETADAIIIGHVLETKKIINSYTGLTFYWARIKTLGGEMDVVADPEVLIGNLTVGSVLSGTFWLSGRIVSDEE